MKMHWKEKESKQQQKKIICRFKSLLLYTSKRNEENEQN